MCEGGILLQNLNKYQLKTATHLNEPMLVLAGAGSGKTKVLTTRIAWLIRENIISTTEFLALTFTNKAAKEMLDRVSSISKLDSRDMWIGTFHSICFRILMNYYKSNNFPLILQILDSNEQFNIIKKLLIKRNISDENTAKEVQKFITRKKDLGLRSKDLYPSQNQENELIEIYKEYEIFCIEHYIFDFTELLLRCIEILTTNEELKNHYINQFKHILVDEFQDTNELQYKFLFLIGHSCNNIFVVGDDDQSIYSFRGAKVTNMRLFMKDFNIQLPIKLEQNYRSTKNILIAANSLIKNNNTNNTKRLGKNLWTDKSNEEKINFFEGDTEESEALFVVNEIKKIHQKNIPYSKIAILYRVNFQSLVFEKFFKTYDIPYKIHGSLKFFDIPEIKNVIAYLKLAYNHNDSSSFNRIINYPPRGVGEITLKKIYLIAKENNLSLVESILNISENISIKLKNFYDLIIEIKYKAREVELDQLINYIIIKSNIKYMYEKDKNSSDKIANLNQLTATAKNFSNINKDDQVYSFIANCSLELEDGLSNLSNEAVQLMTIHASKGLEFDVVFIVGLEEGLIPYESSINFESDIEEERRLMYVAITRASSKLFLSRAFSRFIWGKRISLAISRFINEIPKFLVNNISNPIYFEKKKYGIPLTGIDNAKIPLISLEEKQLDLQVDDLVSHETFGRGRVLNIDYKKIIAEIYFIGFGRKTLDLSITKINKDL